MSYGQISFIVTGQVWFTLFLRGLEIRKDVLALKMADTGLRYKNTK